MTSTQLINYIEKSFKKKSNLIIANKQEAYLRNQFEFYGLISSERKKITQSLVTKYRFKSVKDFQETIKILWNKQQREFQYTAQEFVLENLNYFKINDIKLFEFMIINKSWWDTIDFIAPKILGSYFKSNPEIIDVQINKWLNSNNLWLQRSCVLFQLKYKEKLNTELLSQIIYFLTDSNEFFINKSIGWILREYSKTNKDWVIDFVKQNKLSNLSKRESLKYIKKNK
ncbi:MAG: DNA alkylation repair protein [Flavobacteriales bacterium]|nr:DNA alkylation repair protein [Flavobacteriales bacterium]|tara:strand:+ start:46 stop:729 length:684 start_codon:yes stop_codon:yes gene_type:complete